MLIKTKGAIPPKKNGNQIINEDYKSRDGVLLVDPSESINKHTGLISQRIYDKPDKGVMDLSFSLAKIKNGSSFTIGKERKTFIPVDQHFNWFQKLMWKWCFGVKVEDYSEE